MTHLRVPYETYEKRGSYLTLEVPERNLWIQSIPKEPDPVENLAEAVEKATESPIGGLPFSELLRPGAKMTFVVENQFRPAPVHEILPGLVQRATKAGCDVSIVIGCAALPPLTSKEMEVKLGPELIQSGVPIVCSNLNEPEAFRFKGVTRAGTPLFVHKEVAEANVVVTLSTTQATVWGYGGSGMIIPAVVGNETIELNHLMSLAPDCVPGNNDCLMQLDKYEALELARVHMAINVIVSNQHRVIYLNAGHPVKSHREAVRYYDEIYRLRVPELDQRKADIAIAGSTPFTDDLFFHTGWAIANCDPVVRDGGIIILATRCTGYGSWPGFVRMEILKNYWPPSKENGIRALKDFYRQTVTGSKSFAWYKIYEVMIRKEAWVVTDPVNLPFCKEIGLTAYASIEEAFRAAMDKCGGDSRIAFIPYGRCTVIKSIGNASVMGSSNTNVPLYPSLEKRGGGRFYQHNFKIPLYPPLPKGDKNTRN